jgi:superfamily II DNA/RNA helicase
MGFDELGLGPDVLRAIEEVGYETPTPIQEQSIPAALTGRDILGCAQTGTGKTASFVLPMIEILSSGRARARMPRSLILTPTRELAMQISENFDEYGKFHKLSQALLIGGVSMDDQSNKLGRGVDVLIATPGRLIDHFESGRILLNDIKVLVIDEADRMLDMGFIPDVEKIVGQLPKIRQTLFFSATMPAEIRRLADAFLMNPKEIHVTPPASPAETVVQHLSVVGSRDKRAALRSIIRSEDVQNALVFCNRKRDVDILYRSLKKHGFAAAALHGDMPQPVRLETLEAFRKNEVRILVASDVAARGLDIVDLSHVFNFDVPYNPEDYIHRIGRTGRAGKEGRAFTIATPDDTDAVAAVARMLGKEIPGFEVEGLEGGELAEPADKRGRRRRSSKAKTATKSEAKPAPVGEAEPARPRRQRRKPANAKDKTPAVESVVGMGNHVPAFLLRPSRSGEAG